MGRDQVVVVERESGLAHDSITEVGGENYTDLHERKFLYFACNRRRRFPQSGLDSPPPPLASIFALMPIGTAPPSSSRDQAAGFDSTQWSVVLGARRDAADRPAALQQLCSAYWLPLYGYLRRRGYAPADAEDLTQGFFAYLLESDFLDRPDPAKGRFRGYLVGALKYFLAQHFERAGALKRGGATQFVDWTTVDAEREFIACDQPQLDPAEAYEKTWALTLLARALRRLEAEQTAAGKTRAFTVLRPFLSATPTRGDYETAATTLATSRTNVAVWVHRLNHRYAELVKLEVAATLNCTDDLAAEMRHLLDALRR
jgi:DNA-directed RNA polymerase specialized sigma24 family protein